MGGSLRRPKSPGVATSGVPKWCIQTRFTIDRAVSGLSREVMARARLKPASAITERLSLGAGQNGKEPPRNRLLPSCWGCHAGIPAARMALGESSRAHRPRRCTRAGGQPVLHGISQFLQLGLRRTIRQEAPDHHREA